MKAAGHRFFRYKDDCTSYVLSKQSGDRVMSNVSKFIEIDFETKGQYVKRVVSSPKKEMVTGL